jgi:hypothetical protein
MRYPLPPVSPCLIPPEIVREWSGLRPRGEKLEQDQDWSLEIAPAGLQGGQGRQGGGLGAQDARAQADGAKTGGEGGLRSTGSKPPSGPASSRIGPVGGASSPRPPAPSGSSRKRLGVSRVSGCCSQPGPPDLQDRGNAWLRPHCSQAAMTTPCQWRRRLSTFSSAEAHHGAPHHEGLDGGCRVPPPFAGSDPCVRRWRCPGPG